MPVETVIVPTGFAVAQGSHPAIGEGVPAHTFTFFDQMSGTAYHVVMADQSFDDIISKYQQDKTGIAIPAKQLFVPDVKHGLG